MCEYTDFLSDHSEHWAYHTNPNSLHTPFTFEELQQLNEYARKLNEREYHGKH